MTFMVGSILIASSSRIPQAEVSIAIIAVCNSCSSVVSGAEKKLDESCY